jgi:predicted ATPase
MENKNLKFGVSNFRVFDKMSEFEFAPITFLTGPNSSGKSSIMKAQQVLSENFDGNNIPMRLYFDKTSKLSSIQNVLNNNTDNLTFHLKFNEFNLDQNYKSNINLIYDNGEKYNFNKYLDSILSNKKKENIVNSFDNDDENDYPETYNFSEHNDYADLLGFDISLEKESIIQIRLNHFTKGYGEKSNNPILDFKNCKINFTLIKRIFQKLVLSTLENNEIKSIESNKDKLDEIFEHIIELTKKNYQNIISENPKLLIFKLKNDDKILENSISTELIEQVEKLEKRIFDKNYTVNQIFSQENIDRSSKIINHYLQISNPYLRNEINSQLVIEKFIDYIFMIYEFEINSILKKELFSSYKLEISSFGKYIKEQITERFHNSIIESIQNVKEIEPVPILKNISENSVFSIKEKSNSFIHQMIKNFENFHEDDYSLNSSLKNDFLIKNWMSTEKFGIGKDVEIDKWNDFIELSIIDFNNRKTKINNLGFGVGQIFSLLLLPFEFKEKLTDYQGYHYLYKHNQLKEYQKSSKTFYLEEPESNLHPRWQSLLVELLLELHQKFGYRFIIETHSEYMIRKAQYLVAKDQKCEQDFKIYYFNGPNINKTEKNFFDIKINKNGMLDKDFGPGFFDESTNLTLDLLRINSLN